ncbi:hypothetical protein D9M70_517630 [compost metagenome]
MPTLVSSMRNLAASEAKHRSQAVIRSKPAPTQVPCTAAITGKRARSNAFSASCIFSRPACMASRSTGLVAWNSLEVANICRSNPPQNTLPWADTTIALTLPERLRLSMASGSSLQKDNVRLLALSGRFSCRWATPSSTETSKHS